MTTYYVGIGGDNGNNGLSWANRKLTLNGAEDVPVQAGDTVYVAPGIYREQLNVDVSGSSGSPITYIGDYDGSHTDGVGGVVRITGSDDDTTAARVQCVFSENKFYRTFKGFLLDGSSSRAIYAGSNVQNWTVEDCFFGSIFGNAASLYFHSGAGNICNNNIVRRCVFSNAGAGNSSVGIVFYHNSEINISGNIVENCMFLAGWQAIQVVYIGDVIVRNCLIANQLSAGIRTASINTNNKLVVNNSIFTNNSTALSAAAANQITEDFNALFGNTTARTNVSTGANSLAYPFFPDSRWFFEMVNGGSLVTPFDMSSASKLIGVAGLSPTTTDMRGTGKIGDEREWGALEYDPNLDIEAGSGGSGGAVRISPTIGRLG